MSGTSPRDLPEAEQYAKEIAEDAHEHFYNSSGNFKQRDINHVLATLANDAFSLDGKIKTTRHDEKVILEFDRPNEFAELGSYGVELNKQALDAEWLNPDERIEVLKEWILNKSEAILREAEDMAGSN